MAISLAIEGTLQRTSGSMRWLYFILGLVATGLASPQFYKTDPQLFSVSHAQASSKPCPIATPLSIIEMFLVGMDPLGRLAKTNSSKFLEIQESADCMNAYVVARVNSMRREEFEKLNASERAGLRGTKDEIADLKRGPFYLQLQALNNSVLMSRLSKFYARSVGTLNKEAKCDTFVTGEIADFEKILPKARAQTDPVEACLNLWINNSTWKNTLLDAAHKEAVAGFYADEFGGLGCTMTFSTGTNYSQGSDCPASKYVLPSPTPSVTPTTTPSPSHTISVLATSTPSITLAAFATLALKPSFQSARSTTPTVSASSDSAHSVSSEPPRASVTFSPLPSPPKKIIVPSDLKMHKFQNYQIMYKRTDGAEVLLDLKCQDADCMYCMLKDDVHWCFSTYFSVYMDLYVSTKISISGVVR